MKEYMTSVFAGCAIFSLLSHLSYNSTLEGVRRFAFGVLLFSVVSSPFLSALGSISNLDIDKIMSPNTEIEGGEEIYLSAFTEGIKTAVCDKFGLASSDVRVLVDGFDSAAWGAEKIRIILSGAAVTVDYNGIEKYIEDLEIGLCEVEIEIG